MENGKQMKENANLTSNRERGRGPVMMAMIEKAPERVLVKLLP